MDNKKELTLIPKSETYIQYMIEIIMKLPRTEKFSIGTEYKQSMYKMLENILMLSKIEASQKLNYINIIDSNLNVQRILLRIMNKNHWIDERISIANTTILLLNKATIEIKGYTDIADTMYRKLEVGDIVVIEGKIDSKMEIEVEKIKVVSQK